MLRASISFKSLQHSSPFKSTASSMQGALEINTATDNALARFDLRVLDEDTINLIVGIYPGFRDKLK